VVIDCTKEGVKFTASGDLGAGSVTLKQGGAVDASEKDEGIETVIELQSNVSLTFSLKYLVNFTKATPLSKTVSLSMSNEVPLLVEYKVEDSGYIRYKIPFSLFPFFIYIFFSILNQMFRNFCYLKTPCTFSHKYTRFLLDTTLHPKLVKKHRKNNIARKNMCLNTLFSFYYYYYC